MDSLEQDALAADEAGEEFRAAALYYDLLDRRDLAAETCLNAAHYFYQHPIEVFEWPSAMTRDNSDGICVAELFLGKISDLNSIYESIFWRWYWGSIIFDDDVKSRMEVLYRRSRCLMTMLYLHVNDPADNEYRKRAMELLRRLESLNSKRKRYVAGILGPRIEGDV